MNKKKSKENNSEWRTFRPAYSDLELMLHVRQTQEMLDIEHIVEVLRRTKIDEELKELVEITDLFLKEANNQKRAVELIQRKSLLDIEKRGIDRIAELQKYLNRNYIFKDEERTVYMRVVSARASDMNSVTGVTFSTPIHFTERTEIRRIGTDWPYSKINYDGLNIVEISVTEIAKGDKYGWKEINSDEFFAGYEEYCELMKQAIKEGVFDTGSRFLTKYEEIKNDLHTGHEESHEING